MADRRLSVKDDKATWFRSEGATATFTVPTTKDSELAKLVRKVLTETPGPRGTSVKVLERPGLPIMAGLAKSNPFPRKDCLREKCPLRNTGQDCNDNCSKEGVVYLATCTRCEDNQIEEGTEAELVVHRAYIGETSRTVFTRAGQHLSDYRRAAKDPTRARNQMDPEQEQSSWMWDHSQGVHGGLQDPETDYKFTVISNLRDPLSRQTEEAVRIAAALKTGAHSAPNNRITKIISLNRKGEYFSPMERWET